MVANRLGSVGNEIHDNLLHLGFINMNGRQGTGKAELQINIFRNRDIDKLHDLLNQFGQIDLLPNNHALAGIGEQLVAQVGRSCAARDDTLDFPVDRLLSQLLQFGKFCIAHNGGKQIIEIVGNATSQHTQ